jgi:hypothetical protein
LKCILQVENVNAVHPKKTVRFGDVQARYGKNDDTSEDMQPAARVIPSVNLQKLRNELGGESMTDQVHQLYVNRKYTANELKEFLDNSKQDDAFWTAIGATFGRAPANSQPEVSRKVAKIHTR